MHDFFVICSSPDGKKKKKKRKRSTDRNETTVDKIDSDNNPSPTKIPKPTADEENSTNSQKKETDILNVNETAENNLLEEKNESKKRRKKKRHSESFDDSVSASNHSFIGNVTVNQIEKSGETSEKGESIMEIDTPKSKKKRKSSEVGETNEGKAEIEAIVAENMKDSSEDKINTSLVNGDEDVPKSAKKKKHKKRQSGESRAVINGAIEDNLDKSINEGIESKTADLTTIDKESESDTGHDGSENAASPKKRKQHRRESQAGQMETNNADKFSPRYTRSMKTIP